MDGHQTLTLEQLQTVPGIATLNEMLRKLFNQGQRATFLYSLSASTSADAYAKWGETVGTTSIGIRMSSKGSIVHHSCLMNVTTATSGDVTAEVRVNDTNQASAELEFNSSDGTGVASNDIQIDRHKVSFDKGDLVQVFLNETGDMVWESVIGYIEVVFDE